jgi:hypothetical protein
MAFWRSIAFRLNGHYGTLVLIFEEPPSTIQWRKVQDLLIACGVVLRRGPGDGTLLELKGGGGPFKPGFGLSGDLENTSAEQVDEEVSSKAHTTKTAFWATRPRA